MVKAQLPRKLPLFEILTLSEQFTDSQQTPFLHLLEADKARFKYVLYD